MRRRAGFTLLEILLATAILLGSAIVLGELARQGLRSAGAAEATATATTLCQNLLAELAAGAEPSEPVRDVLFVNEPGWLYTIEREAASHPELALVRVTVRQDLPVEKRPVECMLERWIRRPPGATLEGAPAETPAPASAPRDFPGPPAREAP